MRSLIFNLAAHDHSMGTSIQARQCQQDYVLQRSEKFSTFHLFWNIEQMAQDVKWKRLGTVERVANPSCASRNR